MAKKTMDPKIIYTKKIVAKPFSVLTCENKHPMFLTIRTLYQARQNSFPYPGMYFANKVIDLDNAIDLYHCKKCKSSALVIQRDGLSIFVGGKKTLVWQND